MSRRPTVVSAADFLGGNRHSPMSVQTSSSSSSSLSSTSTPGSPSSAFHNNLDENAKAEVGVGVEGVSERRRLSAEGSTSSGVEASGLPDGIFMSESSGSSSSSISTSASESESGRKGARGRRGRKSFKEWQDDSRWDLKVRLSVRTLYYIWLYLQLRWAT